MQKPMQNLLNGGADTFSAFSFDSHMNGTMIMMIGRVISMTGTRM